MSTTFSIGQMNQLADALESVGYTPDDVTKLRSNPELLTQFRLADSLAAAGFTPGEIDKLRKRPELLKSIRTILSGWAEVVSRENVIDFDADPYLPDGFELVSHETGLGKVVWDPEKFRLVKPQTREGFSTATTEAFMKQIKGLQKVNANFLDFILANPDLAPENWPRTSTMACFGTVYRNHNKQICVRGLYKRSDGYLTWVLCLFDESWYEFHPAIIFKG